MRALIFDAETTGTDPETDKLIEVGGVLWDTEHRAILEVYSGLLFAESNPAAHVNGLPPALLAKAHPQTKARIEALAISADFVVAHNAPFDHAFSAAAGLLFVGLPWVCTIEDVKWPVESQSKSLISIALAHGVAVTSAHRAIHDCLLLVRLLESIPNADEILRAGLDHAMLPKIELQALVSFDEKDLAKQAGFHWEPVRRQWLRTMALADAESLPFRTRRSA